MVPKFLSLSPRILKLCIFSLLLLTGCQVQFGSENDTNSNNGELKGIEIKFLAGSDLAEFCRQAAQRLNRTQPKLDNGEAYYLTCDPKGSGDVVNEVINLAKQLQKGSIQPEAAEFPSLISVDGEIYQSQLIYQIDKLFPGQNYIPSLSDSPLLAYSPMVFMTSQELAGSLSKVDNLYTALVEAENHQQLDPSAAPIPINYVHTAPTRSNSGLQTLVAQFAAVAGKAPEKLTVADIQQHQDKVKKIQSKITRYGKSTGSLARSMQENGLFWASVGSVYESLVIAANSQGSNSPVKYQAVYPQATFSSNIRAMLPNAPWVNETEKAAAKEIIEYLRQPEIQKIAVDLGLRPGIPGLALGNKFSPSYGVQAKLQYESYRPPKPEVVEAMLKSWQEYAKKPSQVVVVIDTSGSMQGTKLSSVQSTLLNYIQNLGTKEKIALISFSSEINEPIIIDGTKEGKNKGIEFVSRLQADGGTRLYDSSLYARNWLQQNLRTNAINAVLVLTDGEDSGSKISLNDLSQELKKSGFESGSRIAFFTVGYGGKGQFNEDALKQIAELNGGYFRQGDPQTISQLMADLQVEF